MEPKKSEKADVDKRRGLFFLMGLTFSLVFVVIVLNWQQAQGEIETPIGNLMLEEEEELIDITRQEQKPPPPPPPPQIEVVEDDVEIDDEPVKLHDAEADQETKIDIPVVQPNEEVVEDEIFAIVEKEPSFPGGQEAMYAYIGKNVVYPAMEKENGIQGRVIVTFVVEKDGSISNVQVAKSVSPGLDKAAVNVIKGMPRWTPGQQQDRRVRVKVTMPIFFRLSN